MHVIFQKKGKKGQKKFKKGKKRAKYLKIWAKMYKIGKCFEKEQIIACNNLQQTLVCDKNGLSNPAYLSVL